MTEQDKNTAYLIAINEFPKFGPRSMAKLLAYFNTSEQIFNAQISELKFAGLREKLANEFVEFRKTIDPFKLLNLIRSNQISILSILDQNYPALLKQIYDPPTLLYIKGKFPKIKSQKLLAIIGSRKATDYGKQVCEQIVSEISQNNLITVSGLAFGIDEIAHRSTIKSHGTTIAVLGFGILHESTSREAAVQKHIIENNGAVISEFPIHVPGLKQHFPIRNRIISGLCHGTLVIEAAEKSGSLITARSAIEQNREVFAIPGPITSKFSIGTNNLIKNGAHPITSADDVLEILEIHKSRIQFSKIKKIKTYIKEENEILELLSGSPTHIDEITRQLNKPIHKISQTLSIMEIKGLVQNLQGQGYCCM